MAEIQNNPKNLSFKYGDISISCEQMNKEGAEQGGNNRPASEATAPDMHEVQVTTIAKKVLLKEEGAYLDKSIETEKQTNKLQQDIASLETDCSSHTSHRLAEVVYQEAFAKNEHGLVNACADEMEARSALNAFKYRNKITSPALYPDDKLYHFAIVIGFIALETIVNSSFYEGTSGLIGAAIIALAISSVNMGIAVGAGAIFRYVNLPELKHKFTGYSALTLFIFLAIALNLLFATFRIQFQLVQLEALEAGLAEPTTTMMVSAFRNAFTEALGALLFNLPKIDFLSMIMFFFGLLCSIIAFIKGYTFDDKYPGHGDIDRSHKEKDKIFNDLKNTTFNEADASIGKLITEIDKIRSDLVAAQRNATATEAKIKSEHAELIKSATWTQSELNLLIETYRSANRATRATLAPSYFSELPKVTLTESIGSKQDDLLTEIKSIEEKLKSISDHWGPILLERATQIQATRGALVSNEFGRQIENIRRKAESKLAARGQLQGV